MLSSDLNKKTFLVEQPLFQVIDYFLISRGAEDQVEFCVSM